MTTSTHSFQRGLSTAYLQQAYHFGLEHGIRSAVLLQNTGLNEQTMTQQDAAVSASAGLHLLLNLYKASQNPSIGIALGRQLNIRQHGFLGYAVLSSRTLAEAVDLSVRYFRTRTDWFGLRFFTENTTAVLQIDDRLPASPMSDCLMDALITLVAVCGEQASGRAFRGELLLTQAEQPHHRQWTEFAHARCRFNAPFNQLRFPAIALALPITQTDPQLLAMAKAQCEAELDQFSDHDDLLNTLKHRLRTQLAGNPSAAELAEQLNLSERTLRRRLQQLGSTLQLLHDDVRRERAIELLLHSTQSIDQIALSLGYLDPSNFGRAFKRWIGCSPKSYRQQQSVGRR